MKKFTHLIKTGVLGLAVSVSTLAMAQTTQVETKAQEVGLQYTAEQQIILQECDSVSEILAMIAVMHQSGVSKEQTQRELADFVDNLTANASENELESIKGLGDLWMNALEGIYDASIQETDEDKQLFVEGVYEQSMRMCVAELSDLYQVDFN